jgi:ankyrin repeat protein
MSEYGFKNIIDEQLYEAILSQKLNIIKELLENHANINALDYFKDNMIMRYIDEEEEKANIEIIKLFVELNIDINYEGEEGFNCLYKAYSVNRDDIIEYLLIIGVSPHCYYKASDETLLDWIERDIAFEVGEYRATEEWLKKSKKIVNLLKDFGAKNLLDCYTKNIEEYIEMHGGEKTGLFTKRGYINIRNIIGVNTNIINKYYNWYKKENEYIEMWNNKKEINFDELIECEKLGFDIANFLKSLVPENIKFIFKHIDTEDYKYYKIINILETII